MKKKMASLMVAIMTVAMIPVTAFASTKLTAVDEVFALVGENFTSQVEISKNDDQLDVPGTEIDVMLKLTNGKFTKNSAGHYLMDLAEYGKDGVLDVKVKNDTNAIVILDTSAFNNEICVLDIEAYAVELGDVVATFTSNITQFKTASEVIATAYPYNTTIESDGSIFFESNIDSPKMLNDIQISTFASLPENFDINLSLKGNYKFLINEEGKLTDGKNVFEADDIISFLNEDMEASYTATDDMIIFSINNNSTNLKKIEGKLLSTDEEKIKIGSAIADNSYVGYIYYIDPNVSVILNGEFVSYDKFMNIYTESSYYVTLFINSSGKVVKIEAYEDTLYTSGTMSKSGYIHTINISNLYVYPTKSCSIGDVAKIYVSSEAFDSVNLEVAQIPSSDSCYSVENMPVPSIESGKDYSKDSNYTSNTLGISIKEDTGCIFDTSKKSTFTFPEGIEVIDIKVDGVSRSFDYDIDKNIVTIYNYSEEDDEDTIDMTIKFLVNAVASYNGNISVQLGGEFDNKSFIVAHASPKDTEESSSNVTAELVPVINKGSEFSSKINLQKTKGISDIVSTDEINGIDVFYVDMTIINGKFSNTEPILLGFGVIDYERIDNNSIRLGLSTDIFNSNMCSIIFKANTSQAGEVLIKLDNSSSSYFNNITSVAAYTVDTNYIYNSDDKNTDSKGSYSLQSNSKSKQDDKDIMINDSIKNDYNENTPSQNENEPQIKMSIGDKNMFIGDSIVTFDTAPYINSDNRSMFPVRAISEAFGAIVDWNNTTQVVTLTIDTRIVSMQIGSNIMYINGTPTQMNTAPEITDNRTFIPIRDIANAIGIQNIDWDESTNSVTIS